MSFDHAPGLQLEQLVADKEAMAQACLDQVEAFGSCYVKSPPGRPAVRSAVPHGRPIFMTAVVAPP